MQFLQFLLPQSNLNKFIQKIKKEPLDKQALTLLMQLEEAQRNEFKDLIKNLKDFCLLIETFPSIRTMMVQCLLENKSFFIRIIPYGAYEPYFFEDKFPDFPFEPTYYKYYYDFIINNPQKIKNRLDTPLARFYNNQLIETVKEMQTKGEYHRALALTASRKFLNSLKVGMIEDGQVFPLNPLKERLSKESSGKRFKKRDQKRQGINRRNFTEGMIHALQKMNTPIHLRSENNPGVYFPHALAEKYNSKQDSLGLDGLAPTAYFKRSDTQFYETLPEHSPSDGLNALKKGPTVFDCAMGVKFAMISGLENSMGTRNFNKIFKNPLEPFYITLNIFSPMEANISNLNQISKGGNPFFDFFNPIESSIYKSADINKIIGGDIVYYRGVSEYLFKHPFGISQGWNLICTGSLIDWEQTFLSFNPDVFINPLSLKKIKESCINKYNLHPYNFGIKPEDSKRVAASEQFKDHQVPLDYPVLGITSILRFNPESLIDWEKFVMSRWHNQSLSNLHASIPKHNKTIKTIDAIANLNAKSKLEYKMIKNVQKLAFSILGELNQAKVLVLASALPLGKTRLGLALFNYLYANKKKVIYLDKHLLCDILLSLNSSCDLEKFLFPADLIIFDNFTLNDVTEKILLQIFKFTVKHNKALLVTTIAEKEALDVIRKDFPFYIGHKNEKVRCIKVIGERHHSPKNQCLFFKEKFFHDHVNNTPYARNVFDRFSSNVI